MSDHDDYEDDEDANAVIYMDELECFTSIKEGKEAEYREVFVWKWPGDDENELKEWMNFAGDVEKATLLTRDDQHTGMAYILYANAEAAKACIELLGNEDSGHDVQAQWSESERWSKRPFGLTALEKKLESALADTAVLQSPMRFMMKPGIATDEYLEQLALFVHTVHEDLEMLSDNPNSLILYNCPLKWKKQDIQALLSEFGAASQILAAKEAFTHKALVVMGNESVVATALAGLDGRDVWAGPQKQKLCTLSLITKGRPIMKKEPPQRKAVAEGERRKPVSRWDISPKAPKDEGASSSAPSETATARDSKQSLYIFVDELNVTFPLPLSTYDPMEVYISNLPDEVSESDIRTAVTEIGEISSLNVITGSHQPPRAYVCFKHQRIAKNLVAKGWIFSFDAQKKVKIRLSLSEMIIRGMAAFGVECLPALLAHAHKFQLSQDIFGLDLGKARDVGHQQLHFKSLNWHAFATALNDISKTVHGKMIEEQHAAAHAAAQRSIHLAVMGLLPAQTPHCVARPNVFRQPSPVEATQAQTHQHDAQAGVVAGNTDTPVPTLSQVPIQTQVPSMPHGAQQTNTTQQQIMAQPQIMAQQQQLMQQQRLMEQRQRGPPVSQTCTPQSKGVQYGTPVSVSAAARSSKLSPLQWLMIRGFPEDWKAQELEEMLAPYKPLEVHMDTASKTYPHGVARVRVEQPSRLVNEMNNQRPAHDPNGPRLYIHPCVTSPTPGKPVLEPARAPASASRAYGTSRNSCPSQSRSSHAAPRTAPPARPPLSAAQRQSPWIPPTEKAKMRTEEKDGPRSSTPPRGSRGLNSRGDSTDELAPPMPKSRAAKRMITSENSNAAKAARAVSLIKSGVRRKLLNSNLSTFRPIQLKRARSPDRQADKSQPPKKVLKQVTDDDLWNEDSWSQGDESRGKKLGKRNAGPKKPVDYDNADSRVDLNKNPTSAALKTSFLGGQAGHYRQECPKLTKATDKTAVIGRRIAPVLANATPVPTYGPPTRSGPTVPARTGAVPVRTGIVPIRSVLPVRTGVVPIRSVLPIRGVVPIRSVLPIRGVAPIRSVVPVRTGGIPVRTGGIPVRTSALSRSYGRASQPPAKEEQKDVLWPDAEWDDVATEVAPPTSKCRPGTSGKTAKPNLIARRMALPAAGCQSEAIDSAKRHPVLTKRQEKWPQQQSQQQQQQVLPQTNKSLQETTRRAAKKEISITPRRAEKQDISITPAVWKANSYPHLVSIKMFDVDQAIKSSLLAGRNSLEASVRDRLLDKKGTADTKLNAGIDQLADAITSLTDTKMKEALRREVTWYMEWHEMHP